MISARRSVGAVVAGHDHIEQFDHDLAVDLGQIVERQPARGKRANQRSPQRLKSGHVSSDQSPPHSRMEARQFARQTLVANEPPVGGMETIKDQRFGPLLQTYEKPSDGSVVGMAAILKQVDTRRESVGLNDESTPKLIRHG
jgi:hypothetical protein